MIEALLDLVILVLMVNILVRLYRIEVLIAKVSGDLVGIDVTVLEIQDKLDGMDGALTHLSASISTIPRRLP